MAAMTAAAANAASHIRDETALRGPPLTRTRFGAVGSRSAAAGAGEGSTIAADDSMAVMVVADAPGSAFPVAGAAGTAIADPRSALKRTGASKR
jgi:hypothetical protein